VIGTLWLIPSFTTNSCDCVRLSADFDTARGVSDTIASDVSLQTVATSSDMLLGTRQQQGVSNYRWRAVRHCVLCHLSLSFIAEPLCWSQRSALAWRSSRSISQVGVTPVCDRSPQNWQRVPTVYITYTAFTAAAAANEPTGCQLVVFQASHRVA
jgi:hypothetical protein